MNIAVIGLGLMGASLAKALHGFKVKNKNDTHGPIEYTQARIIGSDIRASVCEAAVKGNWVAEAWLDPAEALRNADLVIFCTYAGQLINILKDNAGVLKKGLIMSDICGVKNKLYAQIKDILPPDVDYIGLHPMTGKERDGFENADPAIYQNSSFIICPDDRSSPYAIGLMKDLAKHIGVSRLALVSPDLQDEVIAYTSSLMHIASAALCLDYNPKMTSAFTAGAFRDCTRIADINADAWTELLLDNRNFVLLELRKYISNLENFELALENSQAETMHKLLLKAGDNKRKMLKL